MESMANWIMMALPLKSFREQDAVGTTRRHIMAASELSLAWVLCNSSSPKTVQTKLSSHFNCATSAFRIGKHLLSDAAIQLAFAFNQSFC